MATFGVVEPIVVNERTGHIVGGHQRVKAAEAEQIGELPVVRVDLDETAEKQLNLALNRISGDWDETMLASLLSEIESGDADLELTGFDSTEIERLLASVDDLGGMTDPDDAPALPDEPQTQPGDLIVLGRHRLLCGDATQQGSYETVGSADIVLTDPPYAIGLDYATHNDTEDALRDIAAKFLPLARAHAQTVVFTPGITRQWFYPEPSWVLCWFYGGGQHRSPWGFNCWQPILAYGKDPHLSKGRGAHPDAVNLNIPANARDIGHPCPKPVALWKWLLDRCCGYSATVLDPFAGSGTTAIACEGSRRTALLIEIDPSYCDVIVQRWQNFTGKKAEGWRGNE